MHLDHLTKDEVLELNIATGAPIIYDIDRDGHVLHKTVHDLPAQL